MNRGSFLSFFLPMVQLPEYHLLKSLSFLFWIFFELLPKTTWSYLCGCNVMLPVGFGSLLKKLYSLLSFLRDLNTNGCWILSNIFTLPIKVSIWFFFCSLLIGWRALTDFWKRSQPSRHGINPIWSWCTILFTYCCQIFVKDFCIYINERYWFVVFFPYIISVWFGYQSNVGFLE